MLAHRRSCWERIFPIAEGQRSRRQQHNAIICWAEALWGLHITFSLTDGFVVKGWQHAPKVRVSLCAGAHVQICSHSTWKVQNRSSVRTIDTSMCPALWFDAQSHLCLANAGLPCCCHGSSWYGKWQILVSLHSVRCEFAVKVANEKKQNCDLSILMQSHQAIVAPTELAKQCKIALFLSFNLT